MNIVEYPFPGAPKMEELQYRLFPESLENDPLVLFHATLDLPRVISSRLD